MKKGKRLILGGSSKGSNKEEPKFVDEVTQEPFVTQNCLNTYLKTFHKKTLIIEREVKLRPSDLNHLTCLTHMPIVNLLKGKGRPLLLPTRAFYSNMVSVSWDTPSFDTMVHGVRIRVNSDLIREVLNIEEDPEDQRLRVSGELTVEEILAIYTCLLGENAQRGNPICLSQVPLHVRVFAKIAKYNITPSSSKSDRLDMTTARVVYHILSQHKIDWASFVIEMMLRISRDQISLGFPRLIHLICIRAGVTIQHIDICDKLPLVFDKRMVNQIKAQLPSEPEEVPDIPGRTASHPTTGEGSQTAGEHEDQQSTMRLLNEDRRRQKRTMRQVTRNYDLNRLLYSDLHQLATHQGHPELFSQAQYDIHNAQFPAEFDSPAREDEEED